MKPTGQKPQSKQDFLILNVLLPLGFTGLMLLTFAKLSHGMGCVPRTHAESVPYPPLDPYKCRFWKQVLKQDKNGLGVCREVSPWGRKCNRPRFHSDKYGHHAHGPDGCLEYWFDE